MEKGSIVYQKLFDSLCCVLFNVIHYSDVIMRAVASQITGVSIVFSTVCSGVIYVHGSWDTLSKHVMNLALNVYIALETESYH